MHCPPFAQLVLLRLAGIQSSLLEFCMLCWLCRLCTCSCDRCSRVASRTGCNPWHAIPVLFICNVEPRYLCLPSHSRCRACSFTARHVAPHTEAWCPGVRLQRSRRRFPPTGRRRRRRCRRGHLRRSHVCRRHQAQTPRRPPPCAHAAHPAAPLRCAAGHVADAPLQCRPLPHAAFRGVESGSGCHAGDACAACFAIDYRGVAWAADGVGHAGGRRGGGGLSGGGWPAPTQRR